MSEISFRKASNEIKALHQFLKAAEHVDHILEAAAAAETGAVSV